ncbi:MAG: alkaline phosphatase family protein [Acetobacteraceae bacterium]
MAYPITSSQTIDAGQSMTITFRPAAPGLVNVVVVGVGIIRPAPPPKDGEPPEPETLSLRLDLFAPGATTPALTRTQHFIGPKVPTNLLLWGDVPAAANQLGADWTVTATNTGELQINVSAVVRYQVINGNLGKVDHIIVVMMENRSFDHMLGYLKLTGSNPEVDGLTGNEFNRGPTGQPLQVNKLPTTEFACDLGHGWTDVAGPLPGTATSPAPFQLNGDPVASLASNAGFVLNFNWNLAGEQPIPPHDVASIAAGQSRSIAFRPRITFQPGQSSGTFGARSVPASIPTQSKSGLLGQLVFVKPASATPFVPPQTTPIGTGALSANCTVTAADIAGGGNWTCSVTNNSDTTLTFTTDISNSVGSTQTALEPLNAAMGYYDSTQLPVYDQLARQFMVCDRWFASLPTDTFPNRLYANAGGSGGLLSTPSDSSFTTNPPAYTVRTIYEVMQGQGVDWNIFFSDLPFTLVFQRLAQDAQFTAHMRPISEFFARAATGDLPSMAWIDPAFNDVPHIPGVANDDHPPGDVANGQQFIANVYNALASSPAWSKTLLVIIYDEHGGFFDHVEPPGTPPLKNGPQDDDPDLTRYGLRVPAIIVSPWVAPGQVSHTVYDHTSVLRTILLRFCQTPTTVHPLPSVAAAAAPGVPAPPAFTGPGAGAGGLLTTTVPSMGARTDSANDLGPLLSLGSPRAATPFTSAIASPAGATRLSSPLTGIGATIRRAILGF